MSQLNYGEKTALPVTGGAIEVVSASLDGIHYLEWGEGAFTIVAVHKVSGGAETLVEPFQGLSKTAKLIAPDLRGHGYSFAPPAAYGIQDHVHDLHQLVEHRCDTPIFLLGHSLGARVAISFAAKYPELVQGVIAVEPPLCGPGKAAYPYDVNSAIAWRENVIKQGVEYCLKSNKSYTLEQAKLRVFYGIKCGETVLRETWRGFETQSMDEYLKETQVPTLIVRGENGVISESEAENVRALNKNIKIMTIADAGHNPPWDTPEQFTKQALSFINEYGKP